MKKKLLFAFHRDPVEYGEEDKYTHIFYVDEQHWNQNHYIIEPDQHDFDFYPNFWEAVEELNIDIIMDCTGEIIDYSEEYVKKRLNELGWKYSSELQEFIDKNTDNPPNP